MLPFSLMSGEQPLISAAMLKELEAAKAGLEKAQVELQAEHDGVLKVLKRYPSRLDVLTDSLNEVLEAAKRRLKRPEMALEDVPNSLRVPEAP